MNKVTSVVIGLLLVSQTAYAATNSWDLNTAGEYTVSDASKVEVADDVGKIKQTANGYHTDVGLNIISNNATLFTEKIDSFSVIKNTPGSSQLSYLVSSNNGATWMCWTYMGPNGPAWMDYEDMMCNGPNTETEVNDHIATLDTDGGQFKWKAFFKSYPPIGYSGSLTNNGIDTPELDQINITYDIPVNIAPVINGGDTATISIDENTTAITTVIATDTAGQDLTYSIDFSNGASGGLQMQINQNTGELSFSTAPDFEDPQDKPIDHNNTQDGTNTYEVEVKVTDDQAPALSDSQFITVTILDVNENVNQAPTNIVLSKNNIDENNSINDEVGTLTTTDADSNNFTYSLVDTANFTDNNSFEIASDKLNAKVAFDFETKSSYTIKIQTDDGAGGVFQKQFMVTINDVNEAPASGTTITVDSLLDDGAGCTLRDAINEANNTIPGNVGNTGCSAGNSAGKDDIEFATPLFAGGAGTISLSSELPTITSELTMVGPGKELLTVDANFSGRHVAIQQPAVVSISGITFQNGESSVGGSIYNNGGELQIEDCIFKSNSAQGLAGTTVAYGGAIYNNGGTLGVKKTVFKDNAATGASNSNEHDAFGGAVACVGGSCSFQQSAFRGNNTIGKIDGNNNGGDGLGGAVYVDGNATVNITNTTFSENNTGGHSGGGSAGSGKGGALFAGSGTVDFNFCTISGNIASTNALGGGIFQQGSAVVTLAKTIVVDNLADTNHDCGGTVMSAGFNMFKTISYAQCGGNNSDVQGDPSLMAYDSTSNIYPISSNSLAASHIAMPCGALVDQRGASRPHGGGCDIGAYETQVDAKNTDINLSKNNIDENNSVSDEIGILTTENPGSGNIVYSLVDTGNFPENNNFKITGDKLQAKIVFDYEAKSVHIIKIQTNDGAGGTFQKQFAISINDIDDTAPATHNGTSRRNKRVCKDINAVNYEDVGKHDASKCVFKFGVEPDINEVTDIELKDDANPILFRQYHFSVKENSTNVAIIDTELPKTIEIDSGNDFWGKMQIPNPEYLPNIKAYDIDAAGMNLDNLTYELIARHRNAFDGDKFEIKDGKLIFKSAPDFENPTNSSKSSTPNIYKVAIKVSNDSFESIQIIDVTVLNEDDTCEPFKNNIATVGMHDDARALQHFLNTHNFPVAIHGAGSLDMETSYFGPATQRALRKFQIQHKGQIFGNGRLDFFGEGSENTIVLDMDEISRRVIVLDAKTRAKVNQLACLDEPKEVVEACREIPESDKHFAVELRRGDSNADVKKLQHFLNTHGFLVAASGVGSLGNETMYYGNATVRALGDFQSSFRARESWGYALGSPFTGATIQKAEEILCEERQAELPTVVGVADPEKSVLKIEQVLDDFVFAPFTRVTAILKDKFGNLLHNGGDEVEIFLGDTSKSEIVDEGDGTYSLRAVSNTTRDSLAGNGFDLSTVLFGSKARLKINGESAINPTKLINGTPYILGRNTSIQQDNFVIVDDRMYITTSGDVSEEKYEVTKTLHNEDGTGSTYTFELKPEVYDNDGVIVLDISDLDNISELGRTVHGDFSTLDLSGASSIFEHDGYLYVNTIDVDSTKFEENGLIKSQKQDIEIFAIANDGVGINSVGRISDFKGYKILGIYNGNMFVELQKYNNDEDRTFKTGGIAIYSLENPARPNKVAELWDADDNVVSFESRTALNFITNIKVVDNTLYLLSSEGLEIIDISDIENPVHKGALLDQGRDAGVNFRVLDNATDFAISGNYLFAALPHGMTVLDIADTAYPSLVSRLRDKNLKYGKIKIRKNLAYILSNGVDGTNGDNEIAVVDILNPAEPKFLAVNNVNEDGGNIESDTITFVGDKIMITDFLFDEKVVRISSFKFNNRTNVKVQPKPVIDFGKSAIELDKTHLMADNVDFATAAVVLNTKNMKRMPTGGDAVVVGATNDATLSEIVDSKDGIYTTFIKNAKAGLSKISALVNDNNLISSGEFSLNGLYSFNDGEILKVMQYGSKIFVFKTKSDGGGEVVALKVKGSKVSLMNTTPLKTVTKNIFRVGRYVYLMSDGIVVAELKGDGKLVFVKKLSVKPGDAYEVTTETTSMDCGWFYCSNETETEKDMVSETIGEILGFKKRGNTLFVYGRGGVELYNITEKQSPQYLQTIFNELKEVDNESYRHNDELGKDSYDFAVYGSKIFVEETKNITMRGNVLKVWNEKVYIADSNIGSQGIYNVYTYDISRPSVPVLVQKETKTKVEAMVGTDDVFNRRITANGFIYEAEDGKINVLKKKRGGFEIVSSVDNSLMTRKTEFRTIGNFLIVKVVSGDRAMSGNADNYGIYRDVYVGGYDLSVGKIFVYDISNPIAPLFLNDVEVEEGLSWGFVTQDDGGKGKVYTYSEDSLSELSAEREEKLFFVSGDVNAVDLENSIFKLSPSEIPFYKGGSKVTVELRNILNKPLESEHAVEFKMEYADKVETVPAAAIGGGVYQTDVSVASPQKVHVSTKIDGQEWESGVGDINFILKERVLALDDTTIEVAENASGVRSTQIYGHQHYIKIVVKLHDSLGDVVNNSDNVVELSASGTGRASAPVFDNGEYVFKLDNSKPAEEITLRAKVNGVFSGESLVIKIINHNGSIGNEPSLVLYGNNPQRVIVGTSYSERGVFVENDTADYELEIDSSNLNMDRRGTYDVYYELKEKATGLVVASVARSVVVGIEKTFAVHTDLIDAEDISSIRIAGNKLLFVWTKYLSDGEVELRGKMVTKLGENLRDDFLIKKLTSKKISKPQLIKRKDGNILLVFGDDKKVYGLVINNHAEIIDGGFTTNAQHELTYIGIKRPIHPYAYLLESGHVLVAYERWNGAAKDTRLNIKIYDEDGEAIKITNNNGYTYIPEIGSGNFMKYEDVIKPIITKNEYGDTNKINIYWETIFTSDDNQRGISFKDVYGMKNLNVVEETIEENGRTKYVATFTPGFTKSYSDNFHQIIPVRGGGILEAFAYNEEQEYMMFDYSSESMIGMVFGDMRSIQTDEFDIENFEATLNNHDIAPISLGNGNLLLSWISDRKEVVMNIIKPSGNLLKEIKPFNTYGSDAFAIELLSDERAMVIRQIGNQLTLSFIDISTPEESNEGDGADTSDEGMFSRVGDGVYTAGNDMLNGFDTSSLQRYSNRLNIKKPAWMD